MFIDKDDIPLTCLHWVTVANNIAFFILTTTISYAQGSYFVWNIRLNDTQGS